MQERTLIRAIVFLTTVAWVGVVVARGSKLDISLLSSFGVVATIVVALMALFDRFLWRLPVIHRAFSRTHPLVRGTWPGQAISSRRDKPYDGYLVIDQTLSRVSVRLLTETGWSETLASRWGRSDDGNPAIFYIWRRYPGLAGSGPDADEGKLGFIPYGAGVLEICGDSPYVLKGPYWTSEQQMGQMQFEGRDPGLCKSFADAEVLFAGRSIG